MILFLVNSIIIPVLQQHLDCKSKLTPTKSIYTYTKSYKITQAQITTIKAYSLLRTSALQLLDFDTGCGVCQKRLVGLCRLQRPLQYRPFCAFPIPSMQFYYLLHITMHSCSYKSVTMSLQWRSVIGELRTLHFVENTKLKTFNSLIECPMYGSDSKTV